MPQQKSKKIFLYIFLFFFIGTLNNKNLNNINFLKISEIKITGLEEDKILELINNLDFLKFDNLFLLNKKKIDEIVRSNNLVEEYSVFKKYPSSIYIEIKKTEFLAYVRKNDNNFILGSNKKLVEIKDIKKKIPFIFGNFRNENFFELKKLIDETNFDYNKIRNLFFFQSGRWDIETNSGIIIKLPKKDLKESLVIAINILTDNQFKKIRTIDLRQINQIILNG